MNIDQFIRKQINKVNCESDKQYLLKTYAKYGGKDIDELIHFTLSEYCLSQKTLKELQMI